MGFKRGVFSCCFCVVFAVVLLNSCVLVIGGDIVHQDNVAPHRPGCNNNFVLVISDSFKLLFFIFRILKKMESFLLRSSFFCACVYGCVYSVFFYKCKSGLWCLLLVYVMVLLIYLVF